LIDLILEPFLFLSGSGYLRLDSKEFWSEVRDHRLSLRKNLKTGRFELYRYYYFTGSEEVIFTGSLEECLKKAEEEWKRFHYGWAGVVPEFKTCRHRPPDISSLCPKRRVIAPV